MKRKKRIIGSRKQRVVLSDVLPYEVPVIFSSRYFYDFLVENQVEIKNNELSWKKGDSTLKDIIMLLFNFNDNSFVKIFDAHIEFDPKQCLNTIPFGYKISHKENDFRELSIVHPKNQLAVIEFYEKYKELILSYCTISPFSIRKPHKVSKFTYYKDKTHFDNLAFDSEHKTVEDYKKEYETLKTYFVYKKYSNVYKFYESYKYHRCEKKYNKMFKFDISKCFDSIYTHSISWALLNKQIVKDNLKASSKTFAGKFDTLMQNLNYNETNGIIIGPEFSRIFAEIILQQIDFDVHCLLKEINLFHKKNYEIFRYVDDYFVFYNEERTKEDILKIFRLQLKEYKFYVNESKSDFFEKPIITGLTIAKQQISDLLNKNMNFKVSEKNETEDKSEEENANQYSLYVSSNKLITKFKTIIKEADVAYKDILNYTLACIDRKTIKLVKLCCDIDNIDKHEVKVTKAILEILDFTFFIYSVFPRVNTTIKLCMILSKVIRLVKTKDKFIFNYDNKHLILKKIYDEISLVMIKNKSSEHIQVETLYLLIVLKEIGKMYRLDQTVLYDFFNIEKKKCQSDLNYFSIVVLLFYIEDKVRYKELKDIIKNHIKEKFKAIKKENRGKTTEMTLLLFDLLVCPYLNESFKKWLLSLYGINKKQKGNNIIEKRKYWFTKWTEFDFAKEIDAKKGEEVY